MSIGRLIVEFEARTAKFETDTGRAAKIMEKRAKEIDAQVRKIATAAGAIAGAAIAGLGVLIKRSIDAADSMSKLSQSTGVAIGSLSQLDFAAKLSGVDDLGGALTKLNRSIGEAAQGTKAQADAFAALGISVKEADGSLKSTEQVFNEVADAFSGLEDGAAKTTVAMDLFGRSGADLIPLLNAGTKGIGDLRKEADELGLTLDERTGKASEEFNDNLSRLASVASGLGNRLAGQLAPELARITGLLVDTAKGTDAVGSGAQVLSTIFKSLTFAAITVGNAFQIVGGALGSLAAGFSLLISGEFKAAAETQRLGSEDIRNNLADIGKAYEQLFGDIQANPINSAIENSTGGRRTLTLPTSGGASGRTGPSAADKAAEEAQRQAQAIQQTIDALREESAAYGLSRAQLEARKISQMGATDAQVQTAFELAKYIDLQEQAAQADQERAAIFEQTRTPAEIYAATIERLNELFANGAQDSDTYNRAVAQAQDAFDKATTAGKKSTEEISVFAEESFRRTQNIIADALTNGLDDGLRGFVRSFAEAMKQIAAQAIAVNLSEKLFGKGGGGGGLFSTAVDFLGGLFGGGKADGGAVNPSQFYMVGERGPELFVPKTAGTIVPNEAMGKSQQSIRIVNAFDTSVISDYMSSAAGEQTFTNLLSRNGARIRAITAGAE